MIMVLHGCAFPLSCDDVPKYHCHDSHPIHLQHQSRYPRALTHRHFPRPQHRGTSSRSPFPSNLPNTFPEAYHDASSNLSICPFCVASWLSSLCKLHPICQLLFPGLFPFWRRSHQDLEPSKIFRRHDALEETQSLHQFTCISLFSNLCPCRTGANTSNWRGLIPIPLIPRRNMSRPRAPSWKTRTS